MADYTRFQLRGDTRANWLSVNPILAKNEPAIETDTNRFKIGDGVSTYSQLSYGRNTVEYSSLYNVTSLFPLPSGYYSHESAVLAIPVGERIKGLIITYETASGVWYTERFIGTNVSGWTTVPNWERLPNASDVSRLDANITTTNAHIANKSNPHEVTKSQIGLGNVDNTRDIDKPISTLQQAAITATTNAFNGHVANTSNPHSVTKSQVGLGNVDNTSDINKPISSATQTALNGKVNNSGNEAISGVKTFNSAPIVPTPTLDNEAVNKVYVDAADAQLLSGLNTFCFLKSATFGISDANSIFTIKNSLRNFSVADDGTRKYSLHSLTISGNSLVVYIADVTDKASDYLTTLADCPMFITTDITQLNGFVTLNFSDYGGSILPFYASSIEVDIDRIKLLKSFIPNSSPTTPANSAIMTNKLIEKNIRDIKSLNTRFDNLSNTLNELSDTVTYDVGGLKLGIDALTDKYYHFDGVSSKYVLSKTYTIATSGDYAEMIFRTYGSYVNNVFDHLGIIGRGSGTGVFGVHPTNGLSIRDDSGNWYNAGKQNVGIDTWHTARVEVVDNNYVLTLDGIIIKTSTKLSNLSFNNLGQGYNSIFSKVDMKSFKVYTTTDGLIEKKDFVNGGTNVSIVYIKKEDPSDTSFPKYLYIKKTGTSAQIYRKRSDGSVLMIPFSLRYKAYTGGTTYPGYYDNWGIGIVSKYSYSNGKFSNVEPLFRAGEAELAIRTSDANNNLTYVGGSAHGFENIQNDSNGNRGFIFFIDGKKIGESEDYEGECTSIYAQQISQLCKAYTQTPIANLTKTWLFENDKIIFTNSVKFLSSCVVGNTMLGMLCVLRKSTIDPNVYITNNAQKDNNPYKIYSTIDGWDVLSENYTLKIQDHNCKKIREWSDVFGCSMEVVESTIKTNGGMYIATNESTYNKIYFDCTGSYTASADEVLSSNIIWELN